MGGMFSQSTYMLRGSSVSISNLIPMLSQQIGRPVFDKTNLEGLYDFVLRFSPEGLSPFGAAPPAAPPPVGTAPGVGTTPAAEPLPTVFTAVQEVGLKLESAKGPLPVVVIDSVQKPTEN